MCEDVHIFFIISVNNILFFFNYQYDFMKLLKHIGCGAGERVCRCADDAVAENNKNLF